jgi:hypothetical protein
MKPITKDQIKAWEKSYQETSNLEEDIQERIGYIIGVWMKAFGGKLTTWWFDGAEEGQVGTLIDHINEDSIYSIYTQCDTEPKSNDDHDMVIIDKDDNEYGWQSEIPLRWLFEDFEQEIIQGKILYDERLKQKKENSVIKKSLKKKLDEALATQAKAKLSKEELAALKRVL